MGAVSTLEIPEEKKPYLEKAIIELEIVEKKYILWLEETNREFKEKGLSKMELHNFAMYHVVPDVDEAAPQLDYGETIAVQK